MEQRPGWVFYISLLLLFVFFVGPTDFITSVMTAAVGDYFNNVIGVPVLMSTIWITTFGGTAAGSAGSLKPGRTGITEKPRQPGSTPS